MPTILLLQGTNLRTPTRGPPILRLAHQEQQIQCHVVLGYVGCRGRLVRILMAPEPASQVQPRQEHT